MTEHIPCENLRIEDLIEIAKPGAEIELSSEGAFAVHRGTDAIKHLLGEERLVYGVNTGVGDLCDSFLPVEKLAELQENIILSHACGSEPYFSDDIARAAFYLVMNTRSKGYSGLSEETIRKLTKIWNSGAVPLIPMKGSLGASGDLISLAHLSLPLLGEGEVKFGGKRIPAKKMLKKLGIAPRHTFGPKEALSLINGTEVTTSAGAFAVYRSEKLLAASLRATAALFEIFGSSLSSLDPDLHRLKPHPGQVLAAKLLRQHLEGSAVIGRPKAKVQDSYVIRCAPQVEGAVLEISRARDVIEIEMNSVTDNPLFFETEDFDIKSVSGGNFHAQNLAFALDGLGIALTAESKVMERRIERLVNASLSGLSPFLVMESGLNSGFMIAHYLAAALVAENGVLAHPASIQTVAVSANQEDFVSMAMTSANKAAQVVENSERILAILLMLVAQAADLLVGKHLCEFTGFSASTRSLYETVRAGVKPLRQDRFMSKDIEYIFERLQKGDFS